MRSIPPGRAVFEPVRWHGRESAKQQRDPLLVLLNGRVRSIRGAAKYVFAAYPDIVQPVTSARERRRRAELRAKKAEEAKEAETKKTDETKNS